MPVANPPKNAGPTKRAGKKGLTNATLRGKPLTKRTRLAKPGLTKATLPGKPGLTKTALLAKPGPTTTALLGKPGPTTTALLGKPGPTTTALLGKPPRTATAPPRDQAKAELGIAISAISAIILRAFMAHPADELRPDSSRVYSVWNSPHSSGKGKRAI